MTSQVSMSLEAQAREIPIVDAISNRNIGQLITLMGDKVDVNVHVPGGRKTPLHLSIETHFIEATILLIASQANVNALTNSLFTPLHVVGHKGYTRYIEMLVEAGAEIDARNDGGCTPLHEAAAKGHLSAVQKLCELKADCTLRDFRLKVTAAELAGINHHREVKNFLVRQKEEAKTSSPSSPFEQNNDQQAFIREVRTILISCLEKYPQLFPEFQIIQRFRQDIASINDGDALFLKVKSVLESAEYNKVGEILKSMRQQLIQAMRKYNQCKLEDKKPTVSTSNIEIKDNREDLTLKFFQAISTKNIHEVRECLHKKIDVNKKIMRGPNTPFYNPVYIHETFVKFPQQITTQVGESPLYMATSTGHFRLVQVLILEGGAKTDQVENNGLTALMLACHEKYQLIVGLLLLHGASVNHKTFDGSTALSFAAEVGEVSMIRLLIAFKADVNHADDDGETPLIISTARGHTLAIIELLNNGAIADKAKPNGVTPAFLAAQNGFLKILILLETYKVNLNQKRTTDNFSLLQIAMAHQHHDVVNYLRGKGVTE